VVRVPWNEHGDDQAFLDIGAQSILDPYVPERGRSEEPAAYTR